MATSTSATQKQTKQALVAVIEQISTQLRELDQLTGSECPNRLHDGTSAERIAELESRIDCELPEDYKIFLQLHDGWEGFNGDNALLSLQELSTGPIHDHLEEFQSELRRVGQAGPGSGLVFEASLGTRISYFDREAKKTTGQLEVVFWDRAVLERYPSFLLYLQGYSKTLAELIAQERENLR